MDNDNRIVELLTDMLVEQRQTNVKLVSLDSGLEKLEEQQAKTNIAIGELRLSIMNFADRLVRLDDHEKRINKLEKTVLKR